MALIIWLHVDLEDLKALAKEQGAVEGEDMCLWDATFWSERLRESKYNINEVFRHLFVFYIILRM